MLASSAVAFALLIRLVFAQCEQECPQASSCVTHGETRTRTCLYDQPDLLDFAQPAAKYESLTIHIVGGRGGDVAGHKGGLSYAYTVKSKPGVKLPRSLEIGVGANGSPDGELARNPLGAMSLGGTGGNGQIHKGASGGAASAVNEGTGELIVLSPGGGGASANADGGDGDPVQGRPGQSAGSAQGGTGGTSEGTYGIGGRGQRPGQNGAAQYGGGHGADAPTPNGAIGGGAGGGGAYPGGGGASDGHEAAAGAGGAGYVWSGLFDIVSSGLSHESPRIEISYTLPI